MTFVRVTRAFPYRGSTFSVGSEVEVPAETAARMTAASPPFGEIVSDEELEQLTQPDLPPDASPGEGRQLTFTSGAAGLLADAGVEEAAYTGKSELGRVSKQDVRDWLEKGRT